MSILSSHILTEIIKRGNSDQREWAAHTLHQTGRLHGHRDLIRKVTKKRTAQGKKLNRLIDSANNGQNFSGTLVRKEGQKPTGDVAVDEAYAGAGNVWTFYKQIFGRNSLDNRGMILKSTVHFGENFDNAFWNGTRMVYGDGDGTIFRRFTGDISVIGHEMTHGVTQFTAKLAYHDQPGALNESISDCFGTMIKQYSLNQTADQADWVIGASLFEPNIHGVGVRSLKAPGTAYNDPRLGKDPTVANMVDYSRDKQDHGGVHTNSTIPSHAFYLASAAIGGYSWEHMGKVWYDVLTNTLGKNAQFKNFANLTTQSSRKIFGQNSIETRSLISAWQQVGVTN